MTTKQGMGCLETFTPAEDHFFRRSDRSPGLRSLCKSCYCSKRLESKKKYNKTEKGRAASKQNKRRNRHKWVASNRKYGKTYYARHKFRLNFHRSVRGTLTGSVKGKVIVERSLGYDPDTLRLHLERQFTRRMSWSNYGIYWQIDHIRPVSSFTFNSPEDEDFKACWALSNLRPLPAVENLRKRNKRTHLL